MQMNPDITFSVSNFKVGYYIKDRQSATFLNTQLATFIKHTCISTVHSLFSNISLGQKYNIRSIIYYFPVNH